MKICEILADNFQDLSDFLVQREIFSVFRKDLCHVSAVVIAMMLTFVESQLLNAKELEN